MMFLFYKAYKDSMCWEFPIAMFDYQTIFLGVMMLIGSKAKIFPFQKMACKRFSVPAQHAK